MIIFEPGGGKNLILIVLVVVFSALIIWQWAARDPFASVKPNTGLISEIQYNTSDSFAKIRESMEAGQEQFVNIGEEINKQIQQGQLVEETKKYLAAKEEDKTLVAPDNQAECEEHGGQWAKFGLAQLEQCNLFTTDFDTECNDSRECQGLCLAKLNLDEGQTDLAEPVETTGFCSDRTIMIGCVAEVEAGFVNSIICID